MHRAPREGLLSPCRGLQGFRVKGLGFRVKGH
eukprot:CAMPEP_0118862074 /NCGR_PEP_ID=MMETSP1163-20130328/7403_1 /TAXON_ID=124430 /ORGANISM="Phaeomonas parva, Strain CCMP2877" /LENGTH=31 /DNA_ID= /DNA_START= /DNA_END= /DNA_ORIENTATION=